MRLRSNFALSVAELASAIAHSCKSEAESNFKDRMQLLNMALAMLEL
jgi:hypothetical protein